MGPITCFRYDNCSKQEVQQAADVCRNDKPHFLHWEKKSGASRVTCTLLYAIVNISPDDKTMKTKPK